MDSFPTTFNVHPASLAEGTFVLVQEPRGGGLRIAKIVGLVEYPAEVTGNNAKQEIASSVSTPERRLSIKKKKKVPANATKDSIFTKLEASYQRDLLRQERRAKREAAMGPTVSVIFYDFYGCSSDLVRAYSTNSEHSAMLRAAAPALFPLTPPPGTVLQQPLQNPYSTPNMASLMSSSMVFGGGGGAASQTANGVLASLSSASSARQPTKPHIGINNILGGGYLSASPTTPRVRRVSISNTVMHSPFSQGMHSSQQGNMRSLWLGEGSPSSKAPSHQGGTKVSTAPPSSFVASPHSEAWGNTTPTFLLDVADRDGNAFVYSLRTQNSSLVEQMSFEMGVCDFLSRYEKMLQKQFGGTGAGEDQEATGGLKQAGNSVGSHRETTSKQSVAKDEGHGIASALAAFRFGDPDDMVPADSPSSNNRRPSVSFFKAFPLKGSALPRGSVVSFGDDRLPPKAHSPNRARSPGTHSPTTMSIQPPTPSQPSLGATPSLPSVSAMPSTATIEHPNGALFSIAPEASLFVPQKPKPLSIPFSPEPRPRYFDTALAIGTNSMRRQLFTAMHATDRAMDIFLRSPDQTSGGTKAGLINALTPSSSSAATTGTSGTVATASGTGSGSPVSNQSANVGDANATINSSPFASSAFATRNLSLAGDSASTGAVYRAISHLGVQTVVSVPASLAASQSFASVGGGRGWRGKSHQRVPTAEVSGGLYSEASPPPAATSSASQPLQASSTHTTTPDVHHEYFILLPSEVSLTIPSQPSDRSTKRPYEDVDIRGTHNLAASVQVGKSAAGSTAHSMGSKAPASPIPQTVVQPTLGLPSRRSSDLFGSPLEVWAGTAKSLHFSANAPDITVVRSFHGDAMTAALVMAQLGCQPTERDESAPLSTERPGMTSPFVPSLAISSGPPPRLLVTSDSSHNHLGIELPRFSGGSNPNRAVPPGAMSITVAPSATQYPSRLSALPPKPLIRRVRVKDILASRLPVFEHAILFRSDQFRESDKVGFHTTNTIGGGGIFASTKEGGDKIGAKPPASHSKNGPPTTGRTLSRRLSTWLGNENKPMTSRSSLDGQRAGPASNKTVGTTSSATARALKAHIQLTGFIDARVVASFAAIQHAHQVITHSAPQVGSLTDLPFVTGREAVVSPPMTSLPAPLNHLSDHDSPSHSHTQNIGGPLFSVLTASSADSISPNRSRNQTLTSDIGDAIIVPSLAVTSPRPSPFHLPVTKPTDQPRDTAMSPPTFRTDKDRKLPLIAKTENALLLPLGDITITELKEPIDHNGLLQPLLRVTLHRLSAESITRLANVNDLAVRDLFVHFFSFDTTDADLERLAELVAVKFPLMRCFVLIHDEAPDVQPLSSYQLHSRPPFVPTAPPKGGPAQFSNSSNSRPVGNNSPLSNLNSSISGNRRSPPMGELGGSGRGRPKSGGKSKSRGSPPAVSLVNINSGELQVSISVNMSIPSSTSAMPLEWVPSLAKSDPDDGIEGKGMLYGRQRPGAIPKGTKGRKSPSPSRGRAGALESSTKRRASGAPFVTSSSLNESMSGNGMGASRRQDTLAVSASSTTNSAGKCLHKQTLSSSFNQLREPQLYNADSKALVSGSPLTTVEPGPVVESMVSVSVGVQAVVNAIYFRSMCRQELCERYVMTQQSSVALSIVEKGDDYFLPLDELAFTHCQLEDENIADLATILPLSTRVSFSHNRLGGRFLKQLSNAFEALLQLRPQLERFESCSGLHSILNSLPKSKQIPKLFELNLSCNVIADEDLPPFIDLLDCQRFRHEAEGHLSAKVPISLVDLSYNRIGYRTRADLAERFLKTHAPSKPSTSIHWSPILQRAAPRLLDYFVIKQVLHTLLCLKIVRGGALVSTLCANSQVVGDKRRCAAGMSSQRLAARRHRARSALFPSHHPPATNNDAGSIVLSHRDNSIAMYILSFLEAKASLTHVIV